LQACQSYDIIFVSFVANFGSLGGFYADVSQINLAFHDVTSTGPDITTCQV
jgi:hypothetical protein